MSYSSRKNQPEITKERQRVHIYMDVDMREKIDKKAKKMGLNRSEYVTTVLERDLNNIKDNNIIVMEIG